MAIEDFKVNGMWARASRGLDGKSQATRSYIRWYGMTARCKKGGIVQDLHNSYIGCELSEEFEDFQDFTLWHRTQVGYELPKYHLDKDLLVDGNKIYSPDHCVLIPTALNLFLTANEASRGCFPQGMSSRYGKYQVNLSLDSKITYMGSFETIEEAKSVYMQAKNNEARRWHKRLLSGEFKVDPRVVFRMSNWEFSYKKEKATLTDAFS